MVEIKAMAGATRSSAVDLTPARKGLARNFGMTHFVNPKEVKGDLVANLVDLTGGHLLKPMFSN